MSKSLAEAWIAGLAAQGITSKFLARFDFESGTQFIWTGGFPITPVSTGDTLLDGNTFEAFSEGVPFDVGSNTYSESGSDAFTLTLGLPADLPSEMVAASLDANEYRGRPATIWRTLMVTPAGASTPSVWVFRRVRVGSMDQLEFTNDGTQSVVKLTVQSHASMISNATNSTYADQSKYDPNDTSQNYLSSTTTGQPIANNASTSPDIAALALYNRLYNK